MYVYTYIFLLSHILFFLCIILLKFVTSNCLFLFRDMIRTLHFGRLSASSFEFNTYTLKMRADGLAIRREITTINDSVEIRKQQSEYMCVRIYENVYTYINILCTYNLRNINYHIIYGHICWESMSISKRTCCLYLPRNIISFPFWGKSALRSVVITNYWTNDFFEVIHCCYF